LDTSIFRRNNQRKIKVGVIGSYPPPYGGVTIHIQRLLKKLEELDYDCSLYDILGKQRESESGHIIRVRHPKLWMMKYFLHNSDEIIHNHTEDWRGQVAVGFMGLLGKKTIATLHSEILINEWKKYNFVKRKIIQSALQSTSRVIAVNSNIKEFCLSIGVDSDKLFLIPAFLPPVIDKEECKQIPEYIWEFFRTHNPVVSANAFKIAFFEGEDLYGIDLSIELCHKLKENHPSIGFIFFLSEIGDEQYFRSLEQKIAGLDLQDNFLFVTESYPFYPVLMKSDVFIRPTNTDGDAISIREAIFFKVPTVASDCVPRPDGTVLFANRDAGDLIARTADVLKNYQYYKEKTGSVPAPDNASEVIKIYENIIGP
jgi:glycosyltransferase involved in cell wall biosynthesis